MQKYKKYKKQYQKTNKTFDKLYRNSLQDTVIDKSEIEALGRFFLLCRLMKRKKNLVYEYVHENKIKLS